ncbi:hypothetical protein [Halolamina sp.]|uniref:hypothetical protein n=1 Tax=Halolamina sp. TaxID=1940283 RepID=UPI0035683AE1
MSIRADDLADLFGVDREEGEVDDVPLGTALRGRFADAETDSVEAVRDLRERER